MAMLDILLSSFSLTHLFSETGKVLCMLGWLQACLVAENDLELLIFFFFFFLKLYTHTHEGVCFL